jgi:hypothetical protein
MNAPLRHAGWIVPALGLLLSSTFVSPAQTATSAPSARAKRIRVGVYDSRAIAVAYANSREFKNAMQPVLAEFDKAKLANNQKEMADIQHRMQIDQRLLNEQAYSTSSVASIIATVKPSLPAVAKEADVDLIVSKWELNMLAYNVETEDVTDKLVALFHTTDQGWKWAKEIQQRPPVPIEKYVLQNN